MRVHVPVQQHGVLEEVGLLAGGLAPHATVHTQGISSSWGGERRREKRGVRRREKRGGEERREKRGGRREKRQAVNKLRAA